MAKKFSEYKKDRKEKEESLSKYSSFANRPLFGLLDRTKHDLTVAMSLMVKEKLGFLNEADKNKVLACRSDLLTLEYLLLIMDKINKGSYSKVKEKLLNKLNDTEKEKLYTEDVGNNVAKFAIPADNIVLLCEQNGLDSVWDVFQGQKEISQLK